MWCLKDLSCHLTTSISHFDFETTIMCFSFQLTTGPKQAETGFDAPREYNNAAKKDPRSRSPQRGATRNRNSQINSQTNDIYADRNLYKSYETADKQGHLY